jgi:acylpyruvate hydrolase
MKIICIGRNYAEHAKELNNAVPANPVIFMKPDTALLLKNRPFYLPEFSSDIHYETELVVKISRLGRHIEKRFAHRYYEEIALGIDFTARDIQSDLKAKGLPWELAKAFDQSAVLGEFTPLGKRNIQDLRFRLEKNGHIVQQGHTADMLFGVDDIIAYVSRYFTLKTGDLLFTGTPAGVGPIQIGDELCGYLDNNIMFSCRIK